MNKNFTHEKIEHYLLQQMPASERAIFEAQLKSDSALAQQFEQQKLEHKMMESLIEKDLLKDLNKWKQAEEISTTTTATTATKVSIFRSPYALAIAASLALLVGAFLWLNRSDTSELPIAHNPEIIKTPSNINTPDPIKEIFEEAPIEEKIVKQDPPVEKIKKKPSPPKVIDSPEPNNYIALANTYYETTDFGNVNIRGEETELSIAIQTIKDNDLNAGITQLTSIIAKDDTNLSASYYLASVYNNQKKFAKAIPFLEKINSSKKEFLFIDEVNWLLALSYLQENKKAKAIGVLTAITTDTEHPYYSKASSLLNNL